MSGTKSAGSGLAMSLAAYMPMGVAVAATLDGHGAQAVCVVAISYANQ